jgi:hypothetical protein
MDLNFNDIKSVLQTLETEGQHATLELSSSGYVIIKLSSIDKTPDKILYSGMGKHSLEGFITGLLASKKLVWRKGNLFTQEFNKYIDDCLRRGFNTIDMQE